MQIRTFCQKIRVFLIRTSSPFKELTDGFHLLVRFFFWKGPQLGPLGPDSLMSFSWGRRGPWGPTPFTGCPECFFLEGARMRGLSRFICPLLPGEPWPSSRGPRGSLNPQGPSRTKDPRGHRRARAPSISDPNLGPLEPYLPPLRIPEKKSRVCLSALFYLVLFVLFKKGNLAFLVSKA